MSEKRVYQIIDCLKSVDLHANAVVPGARTRVGGSHDGKQDLGHICKTIYDYDNFCLLWICQEAGVSSPYDNYVYHPGVDELEFVISGECEFSWPGGGSHWFKPGTCFCPLKGMPHENTMDRLEPLNLLVYYDRHLAQVGRVEFKLDEPYTGDGSVPVVNFYETPAQEIAPGHFRLITCNAAATSASYQYLKPGCSVPEADFITHDTDEIIFVLSGTGIATYPDKTYRLRPQLAIYNPAGTPHKYWNDGADDLKALVLYTKGKVEDVKTQTKSFAF
jgi:mannose-6-phosphate isomerase-like protein (cupin superfamily)